MKKQLKLFTLLAVLVVGMFAVASRLFFFAANATYVEGNIEQDTVWTLTDSPFVVINNVVVKSGFTLTIEPGVEVRFGGNFSLTVEGILTAVGTEEKMITFTSNKLQPQAGAWGTIKFANRTQPSAMTHGVVEYATNGITIEKGNVEIKNSEIGNNLESGIYITGDNSAYIYDNTVEFNKNGIFIAGNSGGTTIESNVISVNTENGIYLESSAGTYINSISVIYNTLSTNPTGIHIFGQVSSGITRNSISFNGIGIFYENATDISPPQYNDIYGNTCGMNASDTVPVNAEYNYWGDETGPYHASLNPNGEGNTIQSNGVDLDFIPFLSAPNDYINTRPVATLLTDKALVQPNQTVTFIATTSSDDRRVDKYFFDFGDGKNSSWTTLSIFEHKYSSAGTFQASLKVMDDFGAISNNDATKGITVQVLPSSLDVSLDLNRSTIVSAGEVSVTVQVTVSGSPVSAASITLLSIPSRFSIQSGNFTASSGSTNSTGYFTTKFTAPNLAEQSDLRIIAKASKSGSADGSNYAYLNIVPPLAVQVTLDPNSIKSEAISNGTVHVTYAANPVEGVTIKVTSDNGGSLTPETGNTDASGNFKFAFKAPQTLTQLNATVTATATKSGYWDGVAQATITINPRTLVVQVTADRTTAESNETSSLNVHVTSDGKPVAGATISMSSDTDGTFSNSTGTTDTNGDFKFTFTTPITATEINATITASANKTGYVVGQGQTKITVAPATTIESGGAAGWPLTTILLIVIPIIVVVIVVVLIKMRIIVFGGEES